MKITEETPVPETVPEAARKTLEVLQEAGWCQLHFSNSLGRVCLSIAISRACGRNFRLTQAMRHAVTAAVQEQFPDRANEIVAFNDSVLTTQADVELVLEKVAAG